MTSVAKGNDATAEFKSLVDELEDIEVRRLGTGGFATPEDGARRQRIERRLLELVSSDIQQDERRQHLRVSCDLDVKLKAGTGAPVFGAVTDMGAGGVFVETNLNAAIGDTVDLELERRAGSLDHGLKVRGRVAWIGTPKGGKGGLGLAFVATDEGTERRVRRFIVELLRKRLPQE